MNGRKRINNPGNGHVLVGPLRREPNYSWRASRQMIPRKGSLSVVWSNVVDTEIRCCNVHYTVMWNIFVDQTDVQTRNMVILIVVALIHIIIIIS